MNGIKGFHRETYESTDDIIQKLIKRIELLEQRVESLEANVISEGDLECYAEGLGLLTDEGE